MNENERVDIPNKARLRAQDGHMRESRQIRTMGLIFNVQNSQLLTHSFPTKEIFHVHVNIRLWQI